MEKMKLKKRKLGFAAIFFVCWFALLVLLVFISETEPSLAPIQSWPLIFLRMPLLPEIPAG